MRFPALHKHSRRKNRTVDIDHNLSQQLIAEYIKLQEELAGQYSPQSHSKTPSPRLTADGKYSIKSAYAMHFEGKTQCAAAAQTWKTKAPPKCKFLVWLMLQDRIWIAARLQIRGWPSTSVSYVSEILRLRCTCFASAMWQEKSGSRLGTGFRQTSLMPENWDQTATMTEWFTGLVAAATPSTRPGMRSMVTLTIWELWRERNNRIFRKEVRSVQQIVFTIQDEARTWAFAGNNDLK